MHVRKDLYFMTFLLLFIETQEKAAKMKNERLVARPKHHRLFCQFDNRSPDFFTNVDYWMEHIPIQYCTDILVGFYNISTSNKIEHRKDSLTYMQEALIYWKRMKKYPNLRTHVTVGAPDADPPNDVFLKIFQRGQYEIFAKQTLYYADSFSWDGINIYWIGTGNRTEEECLIKMLKHLYKLVNTGKWLGYDPIYSLSVTLSGYPLNEEFTDAMGELHNFVDFVILKPFNVQVDSQPLQHNTHPFVAAPGEMHYLDQIESLRWWKDKGVPPDKIVWGFPTYSRALTVPGKDAPPSSLYPGSVYNKSIIVPLAEACRILRSRRQDAQWRYHKVGTRRFYQRVGGGHTEWLFFNTWYSMAETVLLMETKGYAGVMAWTLAMDDAHGFCHRKLFPIVQSAYDHLIKHELDEGLPEAVTSTSREGAFGTSMFVFLGMLWYMLLGVFLVLWRKRRVLEHDAVFQLYDYF